MKKQIKQHQKRERKLQKQRLKELRGRRLGLYIHIPFCRQKCDYCDFYSLPGNGDGQRALLWIRSMLAAELPASWGRSG